MADSTSTALKSKSKSSLAELVSVSPEGEKKSSPVLVALGGNNEEDNAGNTVHGVTVNREDESGGYKLYRRRWLGLLGMVVLNIVAAMNWIWFSPIANSTAKAFNISLSQVNWLSQVVNLIYLPMALAIPYLVHRLGIRLTCIGAAVCLLLASWIRYAGAAQGLSKEGAYALLIIAQIFAGVAQPIFQVLGPKFSETWFDLKSRTTATMAIAVANPIGTALGQLIPPFMDSPRSSILVLAVATTVCLLLVFLIQDAPPTPPTFAGSLRSPSFSQTLLALIGRSRQHAVSNTNAVNEQGAPEELLGVVFTKTERLDFAILVLVFGVLVGAISAFSILINQIFAPVGYSDESAGFIGAALLLTGLLAGLITSPIFDRVLTHHLALTIRCVLPPMAIAWIGMIFAVKPGNDAGIYIVACLIGILGFLLLPVGLELGCEITRHAEGSAACLWMAGNLWTLVFVLAADGLRDPNPPHNMRNELILIAAFVGAATLTIVKFTGYQGRRALDVDKNKEANNIIAL